MSTIGLAELEARLNQVERQLAGSRAELGRTQSELQSLRASRSASARAARGAAVCGLAGMAAVVGLVLSPRTGAQAATPPATVTRFQAPFIVESTAGKTLFEVADRPGLHGVAVYSASGEAVFLGFDKEQNGIVQVKGANGKLVADVSLDGFKYFGPSGSSVAYLGADSGGNGAMQLKNAADGVVVDAGVLGAATGYVQVYPRSGKAPFPIPNYIKGSK